MRKCAATPHSGQWWECCLADDHLGGHCWHAEWSLSIEPGHWKVNGESVPMKPHVPVYP